MEDEDDSALDALMSATPDPDLGQRMASEPAAPERLASEPAPASRLPHGPAAPAHYPEAPGLPHNPTPAHYPEIEIEIEPDAGSSLSELDLDSEPASPPRSISEVDLGAMPEVELDPELAPESRRAVLPARVPFPARAISVGENAAEDLVVSVEDLPELTALAIAVHDEPPFVAAAQNAIAVAGHELVASGSGREAFDRMMRAMRSGEIDTLLVGIPGGEPLIDMALGLAPRRPVIIASCSGSAVDGVGRAAESGADLVTMRPHDLERLAPVLLAAVRLLEERRNATNAKGNEAMIRARLDALVEPEAGALQPFELFQRVLELELKRARRYAYAIAVALFAVEIAPPPPPPGVRGILRARAGNALIHSIRDIDLATELDHERYLVLLPYTNLTGAAEVARRIIAAVADGDPVIAGGRTFPPRVVGAVAGAAPGQPLSFARLMRDATRALEQARRDGAELAVQP
jgi:hypothetical protein